MKRSGPLKRGAPLRRGCGGLVRAVSVKKRNKPRAEREWLRAYGSKQRVRWIAAHGCLACACVPSENAHAVTGGIGRKADACFVVPLCATHHRELHAVGVETFERLHAPMLAGRTLLQWAARTDAAWRACSGEQP